MSYFMQESRAQRVRDNKLNKSLSGETNGDMPAVTSNGDARND